MTPIEYIGDGPSGVTINGEPVMVVRGPQSLIVSLLATGKWAEVGSVSKTKPARKKGK